MNRLKPVAVVLRALAVYAAALGLCLAITAWSLKLWKADLAVPLSNSGDSLFTQLWIKTIIEGGWYLHNDHVGAPASLDLHDFPMADNLNFLVLKSIALIRPDTAFVFNAYYLLTFPLVTLTTLLVLRHFGVSSLASILASLLFTFLPYHFLRGLVGHLFLAAYGLVPLAAMVALWIALGKLSILGPATASGAGLGRVRMLIATIICLCLASAGIYYGLFALFLIVVAGMFACSYQRSVYPLWTSAALCAATVGGIFANASPTLLYRLRHGANVEAVHRPLAGPEIYGLKITQLLLPTSFHRIPFLAAKKIKYMQALPVGNADYWYLGFIGGAGFLTLVGRLAYRSGSNGEPGVLEVLSVLNIFAVLLATAAGFGLFFSVLLGAWIRCYERMSIYIAFFSLFAVAVLLDRWMNKIGGRRRFLLGCCTLLLLGLYDQTSRVFVPAHEALKQSYQSDAEFVCRVEAAAPPNGMVFQLPYMPFPEYPPIVRLDCYDHLRAYLHSRTLRWSYGAMKGRQGDRWQKAAIELPLEKFVAHLAATDFCGIYVDRFGFVDGGLDLEGKLGYLLGVQPIRSADERLLYFDLTKFKPRPDTTLAARR